MARRAATHTATAPPWPTFTRPQRVGNLCGTSIKCRVGGQVFMCDNKNEQMGFQILILGYLSVKTNIRRKIMVPKFIRQKLFISNRSVCMCANFVHSNQWENIVVYF